MISIVLPTFNGEKYIKRAIDSILNQTISDLELIIVNDYSTDSTLQIIYEIAKADSRVHVINNEKNEKLPKSLNIGFSQAKGEYFTWTSDDNIYHIDALEKMQLYLENNKEIDIVYAPYNLINENDEVIGYSSEIDGQYDKLYEGNMIGACFLYKRSVHEKLKGYDEEKFLVEDYDFWLRALRCFRYGFINECMYDYRIHGNSLTERKKNLIEEKTIHLQERELSHAVLPISVRVMLCTRMIQYYYKVDNIGSMRKYMKMLKKVSANDYNKISIAYRIAYWTGIRIAKLGGASISAFQRFRNAHFDII